MSDDLREKIVEIIRECLYSLNNSSDLSAYRMIVAARVADQILSLLPSLSDVVVKEKCDINPEVACPSNCHGCPDLIGKPSEWECASQGYIERQAEWGEVMELVNFVLIRGDEWIVDRIHYDSIDKYYYFDLKSGGRLFVKEEKG